MQQRAAVIDPLAGQAAQWCNGVRGQSNDAQHRSLDAEISPGVCHEVCLVSCYTVEPGSIDTCSQGIGYGSHSIFLLYSAVVVICGSMSGRSGLCGIRAVASTNTPTPPTLIDCSI